MDTINSDLGRSNKSLVVKMVTLTPFISASLKVYPFPSIPQFPPSSLKTVTLIQLKPNNYTSDFYGGFFNTNDLCVNPNAVANNTCSCDPHAYQWKYGTTGCNDGGMLGGVLNVCWML